MTKNMAQNNENFNQKGDIIASLELNQPYTGIVVNAVGSVSKFESIVKASTNEDLVSKYRIFEQLTKEKKKIPKEYQMNKADVIKAKNLIEKDKSSSSKSLLDDWQKEAIQKIMDGKSVVISAPTSSGKTYVLKYAINEMRMNRKEKFLAIFVAPTFHLALQTYADIQVTYAGFPASILTENLVEFNSDSWIWVGTPEVLLNFLESKNMKYDVGIFDEIHSISTNVFNDSDRINATHSILKLCKNQVIALSATIRNDDKTKIVKYLEERTSIPNIEIISHEKRAVPQKMKSMPKSEVNPENIMKTILKLREDGMLPAFYFYLSSVLNCKDIMELLIDYLEVEEEREYRHYHEIAKQFNSHIINYNQQAVDFMDEVSSMMKGSSTLPPSIKNKEEQFKETRTMLIRSVLEKIEDTFSKIIKDETYESKYSDYIDDEWHKGIYLKGIQDIDPSPELADLAKIHNNFSSTSWETDSHFAAPLPVIPDTKGSFFRFGTSFSNNFNKSGKEGEKLRNIMIQMANAEGIKESEMNKYIEFVMRGMDFGITSLVKEIPFFIQYQILEMLKNKMLGVVFTNDSMSMGINYPLRSVVVFSEENKSYPVSQLLQMAGRCGRRGYDTESYVIFWNIENSKFVRTENIESFIPPTEEYVYKQGNSKNQLQITYIREYNDLSSDEKKLIVDTYRKICIEDYRKFYNL